MDDLELYAAINDNAEKIARLERMVFLMLSIMNGTTFASQAVGHSGSNLDTFGPQLEELWRLQREAEGIEEADWVRPIEPDRTRLGGRA